MWLPRWAGMQCRTSLPAPLVTYPGTDTLCLDLSLNSYSYQIRLNSERNRQDARNAKIRAERRGNPVLSVPPCLRGEKKLFIRTWYEPVGLAAQPPASKRSRLLRKNKGDGEAVPLPETTDAQSEYTPATDQTVAEYPSVLVKASV